MKMWDVIRMDGTNMTLRTFRLTLVKRTSKGAVRRWGSLSGKERPEVERCDGRREIHVTCKHAYYVDRTRLPQLQSLNFRL